jgi:hypothetical protein
MVGENKQVLELYGKSGMAGPIYSVSIDDKEIKGKDKGYGGDITLLPTYYR